MALFEREVADIYERNDVEKDEGGIKIIKTHHGQRGAYGKTTYEYILTSEGEISDDDALSAFQSVDPCSLEKETYQKEAGKSLENHFRNYYQMERVDKHRLKYVVTSPSTY